MTEMATDRPDSGYALGSTDGEHERLIKQAVRFRPFTERLFRDASVGPGQRVLELGSGMGDVAMLVARLVGPSGEVVGVERDARSIGRARKRLREAGISNVAFVRGDACAPCRSSFVAAERLSFRSLLGNLILLCVLGCHFGLPAVHWLWLRLRVRARMEKWGWSFRGYLNGPDCLHRRCEWRCCLETIWKALAGLPSCSKACCHKLDVSVCPSQRLEILRRCRKD